MIRALIVDDEVLARKKIQNLLKPHSDFEVVGECVGGKEAVAAILDLRADVIFLDICIPQIDGFRVLEGVPLNLIPAVVFVTAHDEYAVKAFEVHAIDYLLKPFNRRRFDDAVAGIRLQLRHKRRESKARFLDWLRQTTANGNCLDRLVVKTNGRILLLHTSRIEWIEAQGDYVQVHAGKDRFLIRDSMQAIESRLNPQKFFRIHRSTIVNVDFVNEFKSSWSGDYRVFLRNGTLLKLSRAFRHKLPAFGQTS